MISRLSTVNRIKINGLSTKKNSTPWKRAFFSTHATNYLPSLPVLDAMLNKLKTMEDAPLSNTAVVYIHHPLKTSLNLIDSMLSLGLVPKNTFVLGKHYSENEWVVSETIRRGVHYQPCSTPIGIGSFEQNFIYDIRRLWANVSAQIEQSPAIENLLILDHGGYAISSIPAHLSSMVKIVGIEKTSGGLIKLNHRGALPDFPLINVANCITKKVLESPLIAEAVVQKLSPVIPLAQEITTCGVIGYGAIGKAIAEKLLSLGHKVIIYDHNRAQLKTITQQENFFVARNLVNLLGTANVIFGCSGEDVTQLLEPFSLCHSDKILISCSSEDREFLSLLHHTKQTGDKAINPLADIIYETGLGGKMKILRGGFPYNFDHSGESVPAQDIQLTRALVLGGVFQAIDFFKKPTIVKGLYALNAELQKFIVKEWLQHQPKNRYSDKVLAKFEDMDWIQTNSPGIPTDLDSTFNAENTVFKR